MADTTSTTKKNVFYGKQNLPQGLVQASVASYTIPASGAPGSGDKVAMCPVPAGATILNIMVRCGGTGTTDMTVAIGDDADPDRFVAATAHVTAPILLSLVVDGVTATDNIGYQYTVDDTIDLTFGSAAPTAADVYDMVVTYVMPVT